MSEILSSGSEELLSEYDRLREEAMLLDLTHIALFELHGDDRKGWLQGQVTNDLRSFTPGCSSSFCICKSTGQIEAVIDGWALDDRFCLSCDRLESEALIRRVAEMVILENVELVDVSADYRLISVQGPRATAKLSEMLELPKLDAGTAVFGEDTVRILRSDRSGSGGWDLWIPISAENLINRLLNGIGLLRAEAYEIVRIEAGIPRAGVDYNERTLPPELGPKFETRHVSYTKGCYTGQEILMRIHSRGHTNKSWVGLQLKDLPSVGSGVFHRVRGEVGSVTSAVWSPDYGPIATVWVKNEFADQGEELEVRGEGSSVTGEVVTLPFLRLA